MFPSGFYIAFLIEKGLNETLGKNRDIFAANAEKNHSFDKLLLSCNADL
jgi:hypothetical protein